MTILMNSTKKKTAMNCWMTILMKMTNFENWTKMMQNLTKMRTVMNYWNWI